jgi:hypothetical protein
MNRRDIELLSAYLDGELKSSDSVKLETRLKSDPELASVLSDLRATRTLLRKLPSRQAPRNFTLTRKMVGQNPPLPRTYPIFRFVTAVASLLLFFSFAVNSMGPQLMSADNFGRGGGGGDVESFAAEAPALEQSAAPAPEESAAASGPADMMPFAPTPTGVAGDTSNSGEPPLALAPPQGTQVPSTEEALRIIETPFAKNGEVDNTSEAQSLPPMVSSVWQVVLAIIVVVGIFLLWFMRRSSARRWK